jgi:hypothetical protein
VPDRSRDSTKQCDSVQDVGFGTIVPGTVPSSCAPASRWRQGQALRVLRNLDAAGRGRAIDHAGSEGMPLIPHQGN